MKKVYFRLTLIIMIGSINWAQANMNNDNEYPADYPLYDGYEKIYYKNTIKTIDLQYEKMIWIKPDLFIGY